MTDDENMTPEMIDEALVEECRTTFGGEAADQLAGKLRSFGIDVDAKISYLRDTAAAQHAHADELGRYLDQRQN